MIKIALDIMGGDNAPLSNINGAVNFLNQNQDTKIYMVGIKDQILSYLDKYPQISSQNFEIIQASEVIDMYDKPSRIFKTKPNSSMNKAVCLLRDNIVDVVVSAGNTGCLLSSSFFNLGMMEGIKRPALFAFIPSENGNFLLCDVGANSSSKPEHLLQFSQMASVYMKYQLGIRNPRVALLNIGFESNKGNELTKSTYQLMEKELNNFIGNIESRYIFDGKADIIISDGFTGNIVLKLIEGMTKYNFNLVSSKLDLKNDKIINNIKSMYDYEQYGATPILGLKGLVFKSHGASSEVSILNALKMAKRVHEIDLLNKFEF